MRDTAKTNRTGSDSEGETLLFPDPVIDTFSMEGTQESEKGTGILCSHCHREIKGTLRQYNNQYFDSYCWNLRFILKMGDEEEQRKDEMRTSLRSQMDRSDG
jgi:hypothetical protein